MACFSFCIGKKGGIWHLKAKAKQRRNVQDTSIVPSSTWAILHPDLLRLIYKRLYDTSDFIHFRAVCKWWREAALLSDHPSQYPFLVCKFTLSDLPANVPKYKSMDVKRASLANVRIGQGVTATVWAGVIGGIPVAVKELNKEMTTDSFVSEVKILARLNHINIVGIKGVCLDGDDKFIFYERMEDSLNKRLFSSGDPTSGDRLLTWKERLLVALDISDALKYLHGGFDDEMVIIHRDLKPQNILLDTGHRARIADFGCAVIVGKNDLPATNIPLAGTFGYMDPSYFTNAELTPASDIFAFGGILLDIITGKNSTIKMVIGEEASDEFVASIKDPKLTDTSAESLRKLVLMARSCRDIDSKRRPTASQLEIDLEKILNNLS